MTDTPGPAERPAPTFVAAHTALAAVACEIVAADDAAILDLAKDGVIVTPQTRALTDKLRAAVNAYLGAAAAAKLAEPKALIAAGLAQVNRLPGDAESEQDEIKGRLLAVFTTLDVLLDHKSE